jgi:hypothetical protein
MYDRSQESSGLIRGFAGRSVSGIVGSNSAGGMTVCLLWVLCVARSHVEVSVSVWSLVQRSPIDCGVPECNREASTVRRPWLTSGLLRHEKKYASGLVGSSKRTKIVPEYSNLQQPFLVRTAASSTAENVIQRDYRVKLYSATNSYNVAYSKF